MRTYFYPRPPRGGRLTSARTVPEHVHFYPRPPRGGRRGSPGSPRRCAWISTHALREEGDVNWKAAVRTWEQFLPTPSARRATAARSSSTPSPTDFYPRPPRGGRPGLPGIPVTSGGFLPTPSARRATSLPADMLNVPPNFYPRPPRGGRHAVTRTYTVPSMISTHALREEGDPPLPSRQTSTR